MLNVKTLDVQKLETWKKIDVIYAWPNRVPFEVNGNLVTSTTNASETSLLSD